MNLDPAEVADTAAHVSSDVKTATDRIADYAYHPSAAAATGYAALLGEQTVQVLATDTWQVTSQLDLAGHTDGAAQRIAVSGVAAIATDTFFGPGGGSTGFACVAVGCGGAASTASRCRRDGGGPGSYGRRPRRRGTRAADRRTGRRRAHEERPAAAGRRRGGRRASAARRVSRSPREVCNRDLNFQLRQRPRCYRRLPSRPRERQLAWIDVRCGHGPRAAP